MVCRAVFEAVVKTFVYGSAVIVHMFGHSVMHSICSFLKTVFLSAPPLCPLAACRLVSSHRALGMEISIVITLAE